MTTTTMNLIAKQTVGSGGAASVTFSNIPQTFTDLKVVYSARSTNAVIADNVLVSFNGSSSNFTGKYLWTDVNSIGSGSDTTPVGAYAGSSATANTFSNVEFYVPNYTSSNNKSFSVDSISENNATAGSLYFDAKLWSNTAAITSITLTPNTGSFTEFTTAYLYGISNSSTQNTTTPSATGGDVIATDGTYWYHAFKYSGTFTPLKGLTADVLVVAGGGGSGGYGGGGGAGGLVGLTSQSLTSGTGYTCTVGAGGSAGANVANGGSGSNSQFSSLTAAVGGGGGGGRLNNGITGGSGGGGGADANSTGGSGTSSQGYGGGGGHFNGSTYSFGGGGGGATTAGTDGATSNSGASGSGGTGSSAYSSWGLATFTGQNSGGTYYYAGGGVGAYYDNGTAHTGVAGLGGGGTINTAGSANTGGGGGGKDTTTGTTGTAGGSGLVIVRYAV